MKIAILALLAAIMSGCSSTGDEKEMLLEGAAVCNTACTKNPNISEISTSGAGGIPLIFLGSVKLKCRCNRLSN